MMKPTYTIAIAAIFLVAAFAGVALMDDEADAEPVEVTPVKNTVIYAVGSAQLPMKAGSDGTVTLYGPEDVADFYTPGIGEVFKYWKDNSSAAVYQFGATIAVPAEGLVLVPGTEVVTTATFVSGEDTLVVAPSSISETGTEEKIIKMQTAEEGYKFLGWTSSADTGDVIKYYIYDAAQDKFVTNDESNTEYTVPVGATMTAQFQRLHNITWIVEGVEYEGNVEAPNMPVSPSVPNHTFLGWMDESGNVVIGPAASEADVNKVIQSIDEDTIFTAKFEANIVYVTYMNGADTFDVREVRYGSTAPNLALPTTGYKYWAIEISPEIENEDGTVTPAVYEQYDFDSPVTEPIVLYAIEADPEPTIITFTFYIEGTPYPYVTSDRFTIPDTDRAGYNFIGWTIQGGDGTRLTNEQVLAYIATCTESAVFTAVYEPVEVVEYTVTFMNGTSVVGTVKVVAGETVAEDAVAAPEGMFWNFDFATAINGDTTVYAAPEKVTVKFAVGDTIYEAYTQTIEYGGTVSAPAQFVFPAGYDGWNFDFATLITEDMTIYASEIPAPVEEPAFYETTSGQVAIVLVAFVLLAFGYMTYTNMFGLKDKLFGWRNKKE